MSAALLKIEAGHVKQPMEKCEGHIHRLKLIKLTEMDQILFEPSIH